MADNKGASRPPPDALTPSPHPPIERTYDIMKRERKNRSFDPRALSALIYGGEDRVKRMDELAEIIRLEPVYHKWGNNWSDYEKDYVRATEMMKYTQAIRRRLKLSDEDYEMFLQLADGFLCFPQVAVHEGLFIPTLKNFCTPEQLSKYLPMAEKYHIIGGYAQTELGHGSNVRGLETVALYEPEKQEFEIINATISSTKAWVGNVGKTATHVVLFARLYIGKTDHGVHPFLVQIRSLEDHRPLPGVFVGHIGPKMGFNAMDNGYLRFHKYRIPRENMLMRFAQVTADGKYVAPKNARLTQLSMLGSRASLIGLGAQQLARGCTIAVRFTAIRVQGGGNPEQQLLNYPTHQYALMPLVASSYAMHFTSKYVSVLMKKLNDAIAQGDLSMLDEIHAITAGLKSLSTEITATGLESCRKACGAFGYSAYSALPAMSNTFVHLVTGEGDNTLMSQQTTHFLLRAMKAAQQDKPISRTASYFSQAADLLKKCTASSAADFAKDDVVMSLLKARTVAAIKDLATKLEKPGASLDKFLFESQRVADAHSCYMVVFCFVAGIQAAKKAGSAAAPVLAALEKLCHSLGVYFIESRVGQYLEMELLSASQVPPLREHLAAALADARRDAVTFVDAFNFSDNLLDSDIGRWDGIPYSRILIRATFDPLNKQGDVHEASYEHIRALIHDDLKEFMKMEGQMPSI